ncbi:MAG: hypothetical protein ACK5M1_12715 [Xanthomarina gelatinilytica]|uniref:hypothetical protein n=1 Tax=Xanthomarina gelatinilytica TaxID=1137281 RepID=UPI003A86CCF3
MPKSINENFVQKLAEANTKYEVEQKNNRILSQKLELEQKQKEKNRLIYVSSLIFGLALLLAYLLYKRKKQLNKENKKYLSELNRNKRLQALVKQNANSPQKVKGIDDPNFKTYIQDILTINDDIFEVYVELVKGKSYEEVANTIDNISLSGAKTRINKLYEALKIYSKKDLDEKMTKSQSIKIFNDLYVEYQLK